jgi:hypothetical protein
MTPPLLRALSAGFAAFHSSTANTSFTCMRSSEHQHNKLLAAHVLSSSCPNSGVVVQSVPGRTPTCKTNGSATTCACASGCPASRLSRTGSATAADTAGPGTVDWVERATAGTHPAFPSLRDRDPARPLLQEALEEGVLPTQLGPQRPGRVAQPHAGRPSRPGTEGHDSASPGRPTAWRHQGDQEWDLLDVGIICPGSQRLVSKGTDTISG